MEFSGSDKKCLRFNGDFRFSYQLVIMFDTKLEWRPAATFLYIFYK